MHQAMICENFGFAALVIVIYLVVIYGEEIRKWCHPVGLNLTVFVASCRLHRLEENLRHGGYIRTTSSAPVTYLETSTGGSNRSYVQVNKGPQEIKTHFYLIWNDEP